MKASVWPATCDEEMTHVTPRSTVRSLPQCSLMAHAEVSDSKPDPNGGVDMKTTVGRLNGEIDPAMACHRGGAHARVKAVVRKWGCVYRCVDSRGSSRLVCGDRSGHAKKCPNRSRQSLAAPDRWCCPCTGLYMEAYGRCNWGRAQLVRTQMRVPGRPTGLAAMNNRIKTNQRNSTLPLELKT